MFKVALLSLLFSGMVHAQYSNESEVSVVVSGGNTEVEVYNGQTKNTYKKEKNTYVLGGHYTYATSSQVESARNWDVNFRYERALSKKWSAFFGAQVEGDKFQGIDKRYNFDLGGIYKYFTTDKHNLLSEAGYRLTKEEYLTVTKADETFSKARLYTEYNRKHSEAVSFKIWAEYLYNFNETEDWLLNFEPSLNVVLTNMLSFKLAYKGMYDNEPVSGNKKYDYNYTTGLIAKF